MIFLYIIYALVGITIIIFVHELGHFLTAKWAGIRVERFSLGFDPPFRGKNLRLCSWRWGETEYVIGVIPFGGYVKLAGEVLADSEKEPAPDELLAKPAGARAIVFAAGSAMNVFSGFLFFILAFTLGVSFTGPEIGAVVPGSPAWEAGLRAGDTVLAVNDEPIRDFVEMKIAVALAERSKPLALRVSRQAGASQVEPGQAPARTAPEGTAAEVLELSVTPRWNQQGFNEIGVAPAFTDTLEDLDKDGILARCGLRAGDRIVGAEIRGQRLPSAPFTVLADAIQGFHSLRPSQPFRLLVERGGKSEWLEVVERPRGARELKAPGSTGFSPEGPGADPSAGSSATPGTSPGTGSGADSRTGPEVGSREERPQIGVSPGPGSVVRSIRPGSPAAAVLRPRDRLLEVDGQAVSTVDWLPALESWRGKDGKLGLSILSLQGERREAAVDRDEFLRWNLAGDIYWADYSLEVGSLKEGTPLEALGLRVGDVLTEVSGKACYDEDDIAEVLKDREVSKLPVRVVRGGQPVDFSADREAIARLDGVTFYTMPPVAAVLPGGPADAAGIVPGSRFLRLDGEALFSWRELLQRVSSKKPGAEALVAWRDPAGQERESKLRIGLPAVDRLFSKYAEVTMQAGPLKAISLGAHRTVLISKQVFLTLKSLIRHDVSAKNLAGPVGIVHQFTVVLEHGPLSLLLYWLALISVNLGLLNLLPFPILDGGHLLFLAIEKVKGSPVSVRVQEWAINIAFFLILFLAVFVTFNDIKRIFQ